MKTLAIIGGGAAGLTAAVAAGLAVRDRGKAHIAVYEADDRVGRSILATGNGRCNFSNAHGELSAYRNSGFVSTVLDVLERRAPDYLPGLSGQDAGNPASLEEFSNQNAVLHFFASLGLLWREEGEGRLYPLTGKASSVLDVLRSTARSLDVEECCEARVTAIEPPRHAGDHYLLRFKDGRLVHPDAVIVSVGGRISEKLLPPGFDYVEPRPVLGPLRTNTELVRQLDNIRVRCVVDLLHANTEEVLGSERGELLFRKYGVSGIAIYNLSRFAHPGDQLVIDLLPDVPDEQVDAFAQERCSQLQSMGAGNLTCERFFQGLILPQVARTLLKQEGIAEEEPCSAALALKLVHVVKAIRLTVEAMGEARQCQVHRGGVVPESFDVSTLESLRYPGLFVVGEALDVDGPCGGYNLHWAWASGMLAGFSAGEQCR